MKTFSITISPRNGLPFGIVIQAFTSGAAYYSAKQMFPDAVIWLNK